MYSVSKKFYFNAAHRIKTHQWVCKNVHGHNYICLVDIQSDIIDSDGMIVDFKEMKRIQERLDHHLDHSYLFEQGDLIGEFLQSQWMKTYTLPLPPTTEVLAKHIFEQVTSLWFAVSRVELRETHKCKATYTK